MNGGLQLILVDSDLRRRAQIAHRIISSDVHVEPFEDAAELIAHWPSAGLIFACDDGGAIPALVDHMGRTGNWLPVVAFAEAPPTRAVVKAMQEGALDYLVWPFEDDLIEVLEIAQEKGKSLTSARLREATARGRVEKLSERERQVLTGIASGLSNDLIGRRLGISPRTVEIHRANMLAKIGANHSSEAIRIAIEASLVD